MSKTVGAVKYCEKCDVYYCDHCHQHDVWEDLYAAKVRDIPKSDREQYKRADRITISPKASGGDCNLKSWQKEK